MATPYHFSNASSGTVRLQQTYLVFMSAPQPEKSVPAGNSVTRRARSHPASSYFVLTFVVSWTGALLLVAPRLLRGESIPKFTGLMMFPLMLLGPLFAGITMTAATGGAPALRHLRSRLRPASFPLRWYALLLLPPALMAAVLLLLTYLVSTVFAPNRFVVGVGFGVVAGLVEEIGWMGFAFPAMAQRRSAFMSAILLGLLWSLWHAPVIDYLGTATPHGSWWAPYFVAFAAVMTAMRVLIVWAWRHTGSVLLAQLMHASSTGALVVLSPSRVTAPEETLWYLVYALALWILVAVIRAITGPDLGRARPENAAQRKNGVFAF